MKYLQKIASDNRKHALNGLLFRNGNIVACDSYKYIETENPFEFHQEALLHTTHTNIIDDIRLENENVAGHEDTNDRAWIYRNDMQSLATINDPDDYPDIDAVTPDGEPDETIKINFEHARELFEVLDRDCEDTGGTLEIYHNGADNQIKIEGDDGTTAVLQGTR